MRNLSCHSIGHGINTIVAKIIDLYDEGDIEESVARELIKTARKAVHWCDGNEYEAVECLEENRRCGKCLREVGDEEKLYSLWDISRDVYDKDRILDDYDEPLAYASLCADCFDEVVDTFTGDEGTGELEREKMDTDM